MSKILVSIVNYCDPEFYSTVRSLWENAEEPENLIFSLVSEDTQEYDFNFIPTKQLVYRHFDLSEYRGGLCWARNLATMIDQDFDYFIQFDSHTHAKFAWDTRVLALYKTLPEGKNIISYCPADYEINSDGSINTSVYPNISLMASDFERLIPGFTFPGYAMLKDGDVVPGLWVTCCYLFTPKEWLEEVGISPKSAFNTEEFSLSLRTYAKGWKVYAKGGRDVFHHSSHRQPDGVITRRDLRPWADDRKEKYWEHVKKATTLVSSLMAGNEDVPKEKSEEFLDLLGLSKSYLKYNPEYYSYITIENRGYGMPPARDYN